MKRRTLLALLLSAVMTLTAVPALAAGGFTDVAEDAYYLEAVEWAAEQGITQGKGNGLFAPDETVTRAQAVTFLWRMAGQPESAQAATFTDVAEDAYYREAVQWAVEKGITKGTDAQTFSPDRTCTRAMILTMIYRMEGSPFDAALTAEPLEEQSDVTLETFGNEFVRLLVENFRTGDIMVDVKEGDYFEIPIIWALTNALLTEDQEKEIESRVTHPNNPCPRGEMVSFLLGAAKYEEALAVAQEAMKPADPIETGTVPETVVLDKEGVKITLTGMDNAAEPGEVWLVLTAENKSDKEIAVDVSDLYVNTYDVSPSVFIPVVEENMTSYDEVLVPAGETKEFNVGLSFLQEKGITAVYEMEFLVSAYAHVKTEEDYERQEFVTGDPVSLKTSLYTDGVSYDQEGTVIYEKDGLKLVVTKAENHAFMGPRITIYGYNSGDKDASVELSELKLDGTAYPATFGLFLPAGRRSADTVYISFEDEFPTVKEAEITLQILDTETWEPTGTLPAAKVAFGE